MTGASRMTLGKSAIDGESPVSESGSQPAGPRVLRDTWNLEGSRGDHPPSLNTTWWPIVKQYSDGKVKRTPGGEWKRTWNPMFTSSWRVEILDSVLFVERSGELQIPARLSCKATKPKGNQVLTGRLVGICRPETGWPIHGQDEAWVKSRGGPNTYRLKTVVMNCG